MSAPAGTASRRGRRLGPPLARNRGATLPPPPPTRAGQGPPPVPDRPAGDPNAARDRARRRLPRAGLVASIALPALAAALATGLLVRPDGSGPSPVRGSAPALARLAELTPAAPLPSEAETLRPTVALPGSAGLRVNPLEPITGGIRPAPPARISIPAARIDAAVEAVRLRAGGIEVPEVGRAGWFEAGPRPGEPGRSIVIGHLDSRSGPGLFARVPSLPPGTRISITDGRGDVHRYNVIGGAQVAKSAFPAEYVYGSADRPVLVLITCGGPYTPGKGYRDNVLVYARAA
jgi:hypothetical protein